MAARNIVNRPWREHALNFLIVLGLGLTVMQPGNDAEIVSTSMQANGDYCLRLPWRFALLLPTCYLIHEMVSRLAIAPL